MFTQDCALAAQRSRPARCGQQSLNIFKSIWTHHELTENRVMLQSVPGIAPSIDHHCSDRIVQMNQPLLDFMHAYSHCEKVMGRCLHNYLHWILD